MNKIKQKCYSKKRRVKKNVISSLDDDINSIEQALENYRKLRNKNKKKRIIGELREVEIL